ncbi:MAG: hypothetical protein CMB16_00045 [Euryarchaeota archaeon]|nr:hypothetical protein [Euryarchaeota archaeon]
MVEPISLPVIPPENVWDLYIIFLCVPFVLRLLLLTRPIYRVTKQLAPHGGWFFKRLRELPIKGLGIIVFNEIMAFSIPIFLVLILRLFSNTLGWESWAETPVIGLSALVLLSMIWLAFDLLRIARIRRMLVAIERQNVTKLRKLADAGFGIRRWLNKFSRKGETDSEKAKRASKSAGKKIGSLLLLRRMTPAGLVGAVATGAAVEAARIGAGKVTEMIDEKMQNEFDKIAKSNTNTLLLLFVRDFAMGVAPLLALWLVPMLLP